MSLTPSEKTHTRLIVGIILGFITLIVCPLIVIFFEEPIRRYWDARSDGTATSEPADDGVTSEPAVSEDSDGPTSLIEPPPVPGNSPSLSEFEIILDDPGYGEEISDGVYKMSDDFNRLNIVYGWNGYMSNGTVNTSEDCAILASVTGPQRIPSYETNKCSYGGSKSASNPNETALEIVEPGMYTINVEDGESGATGSVTLEVR